MQSSPARTDPRKRCQARLRLGRFLTWNLGYCGQSSGGAQLLTGCPECGAVVGCVSELSVILPRLPLDSSDRRLHCEDGPEPGFALRNAVVGLRCLCQWVRLHNGFNFSFRYEIKRFVKIFGAVLLAANYSNAI